MRTGVKNLLFCAYVLCECPHTVTNTTNCSKHLKSDEFKD